MRKLNPKVVIGLSVVISLGLGLGAYKFLHQRKVENAPKPVKTTIVVVASKNIALDDIFTSENVKMTQVPVTYLKKGSYKNPLDILGKKAGKDILADTQITNSDIFVEQKVGGLLGSIPKDKCAMSVPVDAISIVSGFVKPGDYVDVIGISNDKISGSVSRMLFQNVYVLAIGNVDIEKSKTPVKAGTKAGAGKTENIPSVTLALSPEDAVKLKAIQQDNKLCFTLRPYDSKEYNIEEEKKVFKSNAIDTLYDIPTSPSIPSGSGDYNGAGGIEVVRGNVVSRQ